MRKTRLQLGLLFNIPLHVASEKPDQGAYKFGKKLNSPSFPDPLNSYFQTL